MKRNSGLLVIGIAFIAIGIASNSAFYAIGIAFLVMGIATTVNDRKNNSSNDNNTSA